MNSYSYLIYLGFPLLSQHLQLLNSPSTSEQAALYTKPLKTLAQGDFGP
jgi:hypothetical protein